MPTDGFRIDLFDDPRNYEEVPLRDRKANLPNLRRDDEKAEFIRDVIALANTSRMLGQPAYLLLGINDNGDKTGVNEYLAPYQERGDGHVWEEVRHKLSEILPRFIVPHVNWILQHGEIDNRALAYLAISPSTPPMPFRVAEELRYRDEEGRSRRLEAGQSWIRFGESKLEISIYELIPDGDYFRYAYGILPYILPSFWLRYFKQLPGTDEIALSIVIKGYQELHTNEGNLTSAINDFLDSEYKILMIEGLAGIGKSTLLKRYIYTSADAGAQEMRVKIQSEEFSAPSLWIPIYFTLGNEQFQNGTHLAASLLNKANAIDNFWTDRPSAPEGLFRVAGLKWVVFLDSVDEILNDENLERFIASVREFSRDNPFVKIVLTSRPGLSTIINAFPTHHRHRVTILPLKRDDVLAYFVSLPADIGGRYIGVPDPFSQLINLMNQSNDFQFLCSIPVMLEIIAGEWLKLLSNRQWITEEETQEIEGGGYQRTKISYESTPPQLSIGTTLFPAYMRLWDREKEHRVTYRHKLNIWLMNIGKLAIRMDGRRFTRADAATLLLEGADSVPVLSNLGILESDQEQVTFLTYLTKVFFAARHLATYIDELTTDELAWFNEATNEFQEDVLDMAVQLTSKEEIRQLENR